MNRRCRPQRRPSPIPTSRARASCSKSRRRWSAAPLPTSCRTTSSRRWCCAARGGKPVTLFGVEHGRRHFRGRARARSISASSIRPPCSRSRCAARAFSTTAAGAGDRRHPVLGPIRLRGAARDRTSRFEEIAPKTEAAHPDAVTPDHTLHPCSTMSPRRRVSRARYRALGRRGEQDRRPCPGRARDLQGADARRGRRDLRRGGELLGPQALDAGITILPLAEATVRSSRRWAIAARYCRTRPIRSCRPMC